mgnify:CR=1 FL=1
MDMRILVVEDSSAVRSFHRFALSVFRDLELDLAVDGVDAMKKLSEQPYDVVLLDINLPLMDGMKVLSSMRRKGGHQSTTPVIMVTSEADADTARKARELGAFMVLHKPVAAHQIRDAVTLALHTKDAPPTEPVGEEEQRREPRLQIEVYVLVGGGPTQKLSTWDISPYGAFIMTDDPLPVGTEAELTLMLPHLPETIDVHCRVAHSRPRRDAGVPAGFGVSFEHEDPVSADRLFQAFLWPDKQPG